MKKILLVLTLFISEFHNAQENFDDNGYLLNHKYSSNEIYIEIKDISSTFFGWNGNEFNSNDYDFLISLDQLNQYLEIQKRYINSNLETFTLKTYLNTIKCGYENKTLDFGKILPKNITFQECNGFERYDVLQYLPEWEEIRKSSLEELQRLVERGDLGLSYRKPMEHLNVLFKFSGLFPTMSSTHKHFDDFERTIPYYKIYFKEQDVKIDYNYLPERVIARAHSPLEGDIRIVLDMDKWMELNTFERIWLMIHEYCHEALGLEHSDGDLEIMFPIMPKNELTTEKITYTYGRNSPRTITYNYSDGAEKIYNIIVELLEYLKANTNNVKCSPQCDGILNNTNKKFKLYDVENDIFDMYSFHVKKKINGNVYEGWRKENKTKTKIKKIDFLEIVNEDLFENLELVDRVFVGHKNYTFSNQFKMITN